MKVACGLLTSSTTNTVQTLLKIPPQVHCDLFNKIMLENAQQNLGWISQRVQTSLISS